MCPGRASIHILETVSSCKAGRSMAGGRFRVRPSACHSRWIAKPRTGRDSKAQGAALRTERMADERPNGLRFPSVSWPARRQSHRVGAPRAERAPDGTLISAGCRKMSASRQGPCRDRREPHGTVARLPRFRIHQPLQFVRQTGAGQSLTLRRMPHSQGDRARHAARFGERRQE